MLNELYIENIAIIEKTSIQFEKGFNVLTGETGAGKSILIGSINAILGERVSRDIVRTGADKARVTASFSNIPYNIKQYLEKLGFIFEDEEQLIISREINSDGRSTCRIFGRPVNVSTLRELGVQLINIHGQHDNQDLLSQDKHMNFVDLYGNLEKSVDDYEKTYKQYIDIKNKLNTIQIDDNEKEYKIDMLKFQIEEIESLNLSVKEEKDLLQEQKLMHNSTKILEALSNAHMYLFGEDENETAGAVDLIDSAVSELDDVQKYLDNSEQFTIRLQEMYYEIKEITSDISSLIDKIDFNPSRLDIVEERLDDIYRIKRKYGATVEDVLKHLLKCKAELENIEMSDENRMELEKQLEQLLSKTKDKANMLTKRRLEVAGQFTKNVCNQLEFLDMPNVVLTFYHDVVDLKPNGQDNMYFLISTNAGEAPKPLSKIASGGELSRIMLSIKNVLADKDNIATLIFDEIDTGVSGRAAQRIGEKLLSLSHGRQVICVTHLAQIAALADIHMLIQKNVSNGKTFTQVNRLERNDRKYELARIIGGDNITPLLLENAEEMLKSSEN